MSGPHADALGTLRGWDAPDGDQERLRLDYLRLLETRTDALSRECLPDHLTAGAVILSPGGDRVLLTLHAKARRWFHMGGHVEPDDPTLAAAALREAAEESGVAGLVVDPVPINLDRHTVRFCGGAGDVRHLDVRYLAVAADDAAHSVSDESLDVRWWPVDGLPDTPDLPALVEAARRRLQSTSSAAI